MRLRRPNLTLIAAVLAICALVAAGCGGDDSDDGGGGTGGGAETEEDGGAQAQGGGGATTRLSLSAPADGALRFNKESLRAKPGRVVIAFSNPATVPHAVEVEGNGVEEETETVTEADARLAVDLEPGEYKFYCPVDGHEQAGMVGTLTVR